MYNNVFMSDEEKTCIVTDSFDGKIVFSPERYSDNENYRSESMMNDIIMTIDMLLNNDYTMVIRREDFGNTIIEYGHDERIEYFGCSSPRWISSEEEYELENIRDEFIKKCIDNYSSNIDEEDYDNN
jgi:hypothetical protein